MGDIKLKSLEKCRKLLIDNGWRKNEWLFGYFAKKDHLQKVSHGIDLKRIHKDFQDPGTNTRAFVLEHAPFLVKKAKKKKQPLAKELSQAHWSYIKGLLKTYGVSDEAIKQAEFHYITSFEHGFKHGVESMEGK